ncbi:MAG: hypothetical protein K8R79_08865 [Calditrichales bacterium]|nr:hypothetical protein [Calditrichales bacterium]
MVKSVRYVTDAWINRGSGLMDFEQEIFDFKPDVFGWKTKIELEEGIERRIMSGIRKI